MVTGGRGERIPQQLPSPDLALAFGLFMCCFSKQSAVRLARNLGENVLLFKMAADSGCGLEYGFLEFSFCFGIVRMFGKVVKIKNSKMERVLD